jgi:hypothetical protein
MQIGHRVLIGSDFGGAFRPDDQVVFLGLLGRLLQHVLVEAEQLRDVPDARTHERLRRDVPIGACLHRVEFLDDVGHDRLGVPPLAVRILGPDPERRKCLLVGPHLARDFGDDPAVLVGRDVEMIERDL